MGSMVAIWVFDNCDVRTKGGAKSNSSHKGSIGWVWDNPPVFTNCAITSPTGTYWEEIEEYEYPYFYLYGANREVVTDWVVITKGASGIKSATMDTSAKEERYIHIRRRASKSEARTSTCRYLHCRWTKDSEK